MTNPNPPRPAARKGPRRAALIGAGVMSLAFAGLATILGSGVFASPLPAVASIQDVTFVQAAIPPVADTAPADPAPADVAPAAAAPAPDPIYVYVPAAGENEREGNEGHDKGDH